MALDDEPEFSITLQRTRNPFAWGFSVLRLTLSAAFTTLGCILLSLSVAPGVFVAALGAILLGLEVRRVLWIDRSVYRFFPDRLAIDRRRPGQPRRKEVIALEKIRHVELVGLGELRLDALTPEGTQRETIHLPPRFGEDTFDACVELLERAPENRFSIADSTSLRLSFDCEAKDLLPELSDFVTHASGDLDGTTISLGPDTCLSGICTPEGGPDHVYRDPRGEKIVTLEVEKLEADRFRSAAGVVAGRMSPSATHGALDVELAEGSRYTVWSTHIETDETRIASCTETQVGVQIAFRDPIPNATALTLLLARLNGKRRLRLTAP